MLFHSQHFIVLFALSFLLYLFLPLRAQNMLLLASSYYFYCYSDAGFASLIIFSTLISFYCAKKIEQSSSPAIKKRILGITVFVDLCLLGFFKYSNFFVQSFEEALGALGFLIDFPVLSIVLPLGISFYTFQTLSYTIDVYRGKLAAEKSLVNYALFVTFFPQLVAGPIERAKDFLPQVLRKREVSLEQCALGLKLFFWGMFKKNVLADPLGEIVNYYYTSDPALLSGNQVFLATAAFSFQVYCDFSGYSDMARGLAKMMGFELSLNFIYPFFARNVSAFWEAWHITLSRWLRDYLFMSLVVRFRQVYPAIILTFLASGLWHGASLNFVIFGSYWALVMCANALLRSRGIQIFSFSKDKKGLLCVLECSLGALFTYLITCYSFLLFRAKSFEQIKELNLAFLRSHHLVPSCEIPLFLVLSFFFLLIVELVQLKHKDVLVVFKSEKFFLWPFLFYVSACVLSLMCWAYQGGRGRIVEYVYFQF